mgnify:CR=1 FL=1
MMTDRPIPFTAPMVRALLEGRKTQTRRTLKSSIMWFGTAWPVYVNGKRVGDSSDDPEMVPLPTADGGVIWSGPTPIVPGDRLWVREAWRCNDWASDLATIFYRASEGGGYTAMCEQYPVAGKAPLRVTGTWRSPRFMPRWASRITLIVTDVRVQRVQEISEDDAIAEGWPGPVTELGFPVAKPLNWYERLWDSINAKRPGCSWADNPFVAAISFRVIPKNIDQIAEAS